MVKLYKLGVKEQTTLEFDSTSKAVEFLRAVYDYVHSPVRYSDGVVYQCKTTAISQYKLCDWVIEE